jgi:hypothetical protein
MRKLQTVMDLCMMVQELRNCPQGVFDFFVGRMRGGMGYDTDNRRELVDDPVIELIEQQSVVQQWKLQDGFRHDVLLLRWSTGQPLSRKLLSLGWC